MKEAHGVGLTKEKFDEKFGKVLTYEELQDKINNGTFIPSYRWNTNGWLASKLGLTVTNQTQFNRPIIDTEKNNYQKIDNEPQLIIGMSSVVKTLTDEGIEIEFECIGKIYKPNEVDTYCIKVFNKSGLELVNLNIFNPETVERTCSTVINRIPDIIKADPGYITTDKLDAPKYYVRKFKK